MRGPAGGARQCLIAVMDEDLHLVSNGVAGGVPSLLLLRGQLRLPGNPDHSTFLVFQGHV